MESFISLSKLERDINDYTLYNLLTYCLSLFPIPVRASTELSLEWFGDESKFHLVKWSKYLCSFTVWGFGY